ncbi:MAG: sigma-70 family RNA polymerase sigma factor [Kangiellaceae bacterium]|nr:sigma-70 family RNA polymerase sigma factor [Kangiellaceae bacterium]
MTNNLSDEQLILRYAKGELASFERIYERHKGSLFRYCLRNFRQRAMAEECFQEIWLKIIKNRERYQPKALFTTYLYRIAQNTVIDFYRKDKKRSQDCEFDEEVLHDSANVQNAENIAAQSRRQRVNELRKHIAELPFEQRTTLLLKLNSNLSLEEIASILDCGKETIKSRLRYATIKLREILILSENEK